ncbi:phage tail tape measure protein [Pseudomonas sp. v388]|uniref:phage tail tape measure protein n=1 Tax=Pseudomonas sp. v388 TaxID=2479849 RepID=UPI000F78B9A3|nr:phage tail tape measure protein [Pseudomonas sp. v388]RRV04426.1 phage tail tape measure protein [Pseudomonas sp. v388]
MANSLQLRVLLNTIDRATAPLRGIQRQSAQTAQALKATRERLKTLTDTQKQISGFTELKQGLNSTRTALDAARQRAQRLGQALAQTQNPTRAMAREFEQAKRNLQQLAMQENAQTRQLQQMRATLQAAGISTRDLGMHERRLRQDISAANNQMEAQRRRLDALARQQRQATLATQSYQRAQQAAGNVAAKGMGAVASGGVALYGGAKVLSPGIDFDANMSKVQAITRLDGGSEELKGLRAQARELGGSTQYTAGQAAEAQGFLGMAGFDPKAIKAAMPGMLDLATAGGSELAETADIASNILSGLGLSAEKMNKVGDVLVGTFTRSNTNLRMLGETMKYAAPMAKTYGIDLETAAAMAGKLGDAGLQGSMGGTALSSIMNRLAAPPKMAKKALEQLNILTADANGNLRDMPDILKEIYDKTKHMGTATRGGLLKAIAGEEAVKGMAHLVDQAGIGELQKFVSTLRQTEGESSKTAKVMGNNLKGDLTTLSSAWQDLGIELEEQQDGTLRDLAQSITGIIRDVKNWAKENPGLVSAIVKTAAVVAALAVGFGGLALTLAGIFGPFLVLRLMLAQVGIRLPSLIGLFMNLGKTALPFVTKAIVLLGRALMMNPIGLAITAIGTAALLIYQYWDQIVPYFQSMWTEIKTGFSGGIGSIITTIVNFSPLGLFYTAFAGVLNYFGFELPGKFTEFGGMLIDGLLSGITEKYTLVKDKIGEIGDGLTGWFKEKLSIHSPSRVFAELGGFTMAGLTQGIEDGQTGPLQAVSNLGKQLAAAGALTLGATVPPAMAIDDAPPVSAASATTYSSSDIYEINIHTTPGMDAQAIARAVRAELARIDSEKAARRRSSLQDLE